MNRSVEQQVNEVERLLLPGMGSTSISGAGGDDRGEESKARIAGAGPSVYGSTLSPRQIPTIATTTTGRGHVRAATVAIFSRGTVEDEYDTLSSSHATRHQHTGRRRYHQHSKSLSISGMMGVPHGGFSSTAEWGRQELFIQTPFTAVFGLQGKERELERTFAALAARNMIVLKQEQQHLEWDEMEQKQHVRNASARILQDLEQVDGPQTVFKTTPFVWAILIATASQFSVGYNTGVMNAPAAVVFVGHSTTLWSWAVAAFAVGGPLGASLGGRLADSQGRRGALLIDVATFLLGGILQTLAPNMIVIILSRFIIGFASGFSSVLVPIYLGEVRAWTNQPNWVIPVVQQIV